MSQIVIPTGWEESFDNQTKKDAPLSLNILYGQVYTHLASIKPETVRP
jgi:hypothetical protein